MTNDARQLFSMFERETRYKDVVLWKQGSESDCVKLLVRGKLISTLENEAGTQEVVDCGNTLGELGLIEGVAADELCAMSIRRGDSVHYESRIVLATLAIFAARCSAA